MRYREVQVNYYGKIGMSLMGFMNIRWKVNGDVSGFEYSFVDYVIKGILWPVSCAGGSCNTVRYG